MTQIADLPPAAGLDSSIDLLDELEILIGESRRVPFSASVVINEDTALSLIDRARMGLPQEIVDARHTVSDRGRILTAAEDEASALLDGARREAESVVEDAKRRAATMVAEAEIVRQATAGAATLTADAERHAAEVRSEADAYARQVMEELEVSLDKTLATVRRGLETLPGSAPAGRRRRRD